MKIVTVIRRVPDAEARVEVEGNEVVVRGAQVLDGMDEYGVEAALQLREAGSEAEIVALAVGPSDTAEALRTALAMGADRARLLQSDATMDPVATALMLAEVVREEGADLVLTGGKQADWDSAALGPALAEALGWPLIDWATELRTDGKEIAGTHDVDGGSASFEAPLPAVVTTQQGLNEPRYPTLPNIMKAKRKPLDEEASRGASLRTRTEERTVQSVTRAKRVLQDTEPAAAAAEIVRLLREAGR